MSQSCTSASASRTVCAGYVLLTLALFGCAEEPNSLQATTTSVAVESTTEVSQLAVVVKFQSPAHARLGLDAGEGQRRWIECVAADAFAGEALVAENPSVDALRLTSLAAEEFEERVLSVSRELGKYARSRLTDYVGTIDICRAIRYRGVYVGGLRIEDHVILASRDGAGTRITGELFLMNLHHEIADAVIGDSGLQQLSSLWCKDQYSDARLSGIPGVDAIRAGRGDRTMTSELLDVGYVSEYASASVREDFCEIMARAYRGWPHFWREVKVRPKLLCKVEHAILIHSERLGVPTGGVWAHRPNKYRDR